MEPLPFQSIARVIKTAAFQTTIYFTVIILMSNLNALVDFFLHPDIPYLDKEHLIVGGITGFFSIILFGTLFSYVRHLNDALTTIKTLESFLPICCNCKKIRKPDSDPKKSDSWEQIETYISQKTTTIFSHGICPECFLKLYPEYSETME